MEWFLKVLQNYAGFTGRARRKEYWMFYLFSLIISIVLNVVGAAVEFVFLSSIYSFAVLIPTLAVGVRRLHDTGKSGWFLLIPIYNIVLLATEGDSGPNEYGADPKGNEADKLDDMEVLDA